MKEKCTNKVTVMSGENGDIDYSRFEDYQLLAT